ncbi:MAG TPA: SGNH/GDSL hydrolase family protein [Novosphingobium sp.]|nr:SGNH/GDSL hydrolase family protein [Novosphingobium sp.]
MSADDIARGLAVRGLARASASTRLLAASGTPVCAYNASSAATWFPLATIPLPAGSVQPDSVLELAGLIMFGFPNFSGRSWRIRVGGQNVAQSSPVATIGGQEFLQRLHVSPDLKSMSVLNPNVGGQVSPSDGQGAPFRAQTLQPVTLPVDLSIDQTMVFETRPVNGDAVTLQGFTLRNFVLPAVANYAPPRALAVWGNSLAAGTGDGAVAGGWVTRLLRADAGRPVFNGGVGGETARQIVDRLVADRVRGRYWTAILDLARNDVGQPTMTADVMAEIDRTKATLAPGVRLIAATCTPATNEPSSSANGMQIAAFNAALAARGDVLVLDTFAALVNQPDGTISEDRMADAVHWSAAGHALVQSAASSLLAGYGL